MYPVVLQGCPEHGVRWTLFRGPLLSYVDGHPWIISVGNSRSQYVDKRPHELFTHGIPVLFTRRDHGHVFGSDTDEIRSECHFLPHFNLDTNANADLIGYEYKTDSSNPDSNSDTFSIWNIKLSRVSFYFVNNFKVDQNHYISRE